MFMKQSFHAFRPVVISLAAVVGIAVWLGFSGEPQKAQSRKISPTVPINTKFLHADQITAEVRKGSNDLIRVPVSNMAERRRAAKLGRIVDDYGSFVTVSADQTIDLSRFGAEAQKIESSINLPGMSFEPLDNPPIETVHSGSPSKSGKGYYIVQFGTVATDELLDSLRGLGLEVLQYVPHNAFFVYGEPEAAVRAVEHSRVRWVGAFSPRQKISKDLENVAAETKGRMAMFNVAVFGRADLDQVTEEILRVSGGTLLGKMPLQSSFFNAVRLEMPSSQIESLAQIDDVVRIDSYSKPVAEDERSSHILAGNYTNSTTISGPGYNPLTQFGVNGTNVTIAMADDGVTIPGTGGFYLTSTNTVNGPLQGSTVGADGGHGHLNASIISGDAPFGNLDATGHNYGMGVAPKSNIINIPLLKAGYPFGNDALPANDTVTTPGPNGVRGSISNNSWGNGVNGNAYDSLAATHDALARDASTAATIDPLLYVFSAGNQGPAGGLTRPKMAKNVIAVGSSENLRAELSSTANNLDDISSFSSRGPAADGRIKPDITAPGSVITGSRAGSCASVTSCFEPNHAWSSGTSHAAPQIAGAAALFTEFWKAGHAGVNPSIAMIKAAILQTGQEMGGTGATNPLPNGDEGWGRANMKFMLNTGATMLHADQTMPLTTPGQNVVLTGTVVDASKPVRVTVVWSDPPGTVDPPLVNNLNMTVNIGGTNYLGNVFAGGISATGGAADTRNNIEQVWRSAGTGSGTPVTVTINAAALNGDGILGDADATDQHFALVAYNLNLSLAPVTNFGISGRVTNQAGRPLKDVQLVLSNGPVIVSSSRTNSFGYYLLPNILGNTSYTLAPSAKRYTFNSQVVNLGGSDLSGVNFTATTGSP